jgi:hypothetical protein
MTQEIPPKSTDPLIPIARVKPDGHLPLGTKTLRRLISVGTIAAVNVCTTGKAKRYAIRLSEIERYRAELEAAKEIRGFV